MLDLVSVIASFVANVISKRVSLKRFGIKNQRVYLQVVVVQSECGWGIGHANDGWIVVLAVQSTKYTPKVILLEDNHIVAVFDDTCHLMTVERGEG